MNKSTTNLSRVEVRNSDKGEILESFILNSDGTPYDLSGKSLVFNENKDGDKFVSDTNVTIVDTKIGHITYQLHDQVHSAPGTAWFDIIQNGTKIDSTTDFYIEVRDGLKCTVYNTTYISDLEKLKRQMEALIQQADGELKTELQRAEQQLNQELQNFRNQYNSLSNDFQNQFKSAQNARQADYNKQKDAINADWFNTKNNINKNAQDTINAIKSNAKQVLDEDQADWNAKQNQWDSTFSAIVKEWQVKTNSLNATVQDLTNKFNTIIGQVSDLMDNKLPAMDSKTDAVQAKVDELRASLGQIDWTTFARRTDNSGGVNLLVNTATLTGFNNAGNSGQGTGFSIEKKSDHINDPGGNEIKTKVARVYASDTNHAPVYFGQNFTLPAGTWTLSFLARNNSNRNETNSLSFFTDDCANRGWQPLGTTTIDNVWKKHAITFTTTKTTVEISPRVHNPENRGIPGGSLYFANFKLEAGSIATDWCQSYLDFDRLDGRHDPIDAPDFNNLTSTGIYVITQPDHGKNYPTGDWGILKVDNADDNRIEQEYYEDVANGSIYHRQAVSGTWRAWQKLANIDDLSKVKIKLQSLDQNGDKFENIQTVTKQTDGSYRLNLFDSDWTASKVNWLLNNTQSYNIESNTDLNNVKAPGLYHCSGKTNITNAPSGIDSWFDLYVNSDNWNGSQVIFVTNANQVYVRTWHNSTIFTNWQRLINDEDYSSLQNLINSQKLKVVKSYDIEKNKPADPTTMGIQAPWLVDQVTLGAFADAHRDVRNHTDYRYPTGIDENTSVNLNSNAYGETGIYKFINCVAINGPWTDLNQRQYFYMNTIKYDNNNIYQLIFRGAEVYARTVSERTNSYPGWSTFATMNSVTDLSDRLQGFTMQQAMFQHRVDYESPSGTINNDTVNFNNYRETGILKVVNCLIQNGPYTSDNRHTLFLKITNLDGQTQYQTVYEGDNLYGRKLYNGSGQWHKYTNTPI